MNTHADKTQENKSQSFANAVSPKRSGKSTFQFVDNRPEAIAQRKLQEMANNSPQVKQAAQLQAMADNHSAQQQQPIQKKENNTGLPDNLKTGIENLSDHSMDDVRVHYNSDKPAQLQAHAYAQGTDIHLASGQEKHLAHEAWHVVQQKQGRVKPTMQMKGHVNVNDDQGLEKEADEMGNKALKLSPSPKSSIINQETQEPERPLQQVSQLAVIVQLVRIEPKGINGLTHLVKMTDKGHIYTAENWLKNERDEVKAGDRLLVDMDDAWYSHRGINQETNWERDGDGDQAHLWVRVVELNHRPVEGDLYVREEMLSEGWPGWKTAPKKMHSIWVQGDFSSNKEAMEGLQSRRGKDTEGWVDMIWLYNTGVELGDYKPQKVDINSAKIAPLLRRSFVHEMKLWERSGDMPTWVKRWLPILDILYEKKSYITMSDLMRMIILYYEGGLYLDVKIKVNTDKALFKERPMVEVDTANFYASENWAIMAHAGSQMLEEMMIQAYHQFPKEVQLADYPPNYQEAPRQDGKRREGKMHVELHERRGVWNVIDRAGRPQFPTSLGLTNPRPLNSWSEAYEDRPPEVVKQEQIDFLNSDIDKLNRELTRRIREKEQLEEKLKASPNKSFWELLELTQKIVDELPEKIEAEQREINSIKLKIEFKQMEIEHLQGDYDEVDDDDVEQDDDDDLMRRLNALLQ